jgi:hypothetical protein
MKRTLLIIGFFGGLNICARRVSLKNISVGEARPQGISVVLPEDMTLEIRVHNINSKATLATWNA